MPFRGPYYYRSVRVGGRPRNEYVGTGPVAAAMALAVERDREARALERELVKQDRSWADQLASAVGELDRVSELVVRAVMAAAGYHRHHRGAWRKRRGR